MENKSAKHSMALQSLTAVVCLFVSESVALLHGLTLEQVGTSLKSF